MPWRTSTTSPPQLLLLLHAPNDQVDVCAAGEVAHRTVCDGSGLVHSVVVVEDAPLGPHIHSHGRGHFVWHRNEGACRTVKGAFSEVSARVVFVP